MSGTSRAAPPTTPSPPSSASLQHAAALGAHHAGRRPTRGPRAGSRRARSRPTTPTRAPGGASGGVPSAASTSRAAAASVSSRKVEFSRPWMRGITAQHASTRWSRRRPRRLRRAPPRGAPRDGGTGRRHHPARRQAERAPHHQARHAGGAPRGRRCCPGSVADGAPAVRLKHHEVGPEPVRVGQAGGGVDRHAAAFRDGHAGTALRTCASRASSASRMRPGWRLAHGANPGYGSGAKSKACRAVWQRGGPPEPA